MAVADPITVSVIADTADAEAAIERLIELASRFRGVWGDCPIPDRFAVADIRPGDRVILSYDERLPRDAVEQILRTAKKLLPRNKVIVMDSGARIAVAHEKAADNG